MKVITELAPDLKWKHYQRQKCKRHLQSWIDHGHRIAAFMRKHPSLEGYVGPVSFIQRQIDMMIESVELEKYSAVRKRE